MKLEVYYGIFSIFLSLVLINSVSSSSLPGETLVEEDDTNSSGLLAATAPENSKLKSPYVKFKSAWPKNTKKPIYFQKDGKQKHVTELKSSHEHANQEVSKDSRQKAVNSKMNKTKGNLVVPSESTINRTQELLTCTNDDPEMQQVCENFCTEVKQFNLGFCSSDQQTCICAMEGDDMTTLRVKLYKPKQQSTPNSLSEDDQNQSQLILSKEDFDCDHSDYSESVCNAYCYQFRQLNSSKCSEDGKSCLCFSSPEELNQTQDAIGEESETASRSGRHFMHEDSEMFLGMNPPMDGMPVSVRGRPPLVPSPLAPIRGCNYYTCIRVCPGHCQSMCMHSIDCYCSCPEDVYYDYDYPLFG